MFLELSYDLNKAFESLQLKAYPDPLTRGKPYTIGYGATKYEDGSAVKLGDVISKQRAEAILEHTTTNKVVPKLEKIPCWDKLNDKRKAVLISFAHNLGENFYNHPDFNAISTCLTNHDKVISIPAVVVKALTKGIPPKDSHDPSSILATLDPNKKYTGAAILPVALLLYRNSGTSVEAGLLKRRILEAKLWLEIPATTNRVKLVCTHDTFIKRSTAQSSDLSNDKKIAKTRNQVIEVDFIREVAHNNHTEVRLVGSDISWFIWDEHWRLAPEVNDKVTAPELDWGDMNSQVVKNFKLGEFLMWDINRMPPNKEVKENILRIAKELQKIRDSWGKPLKITSGYRPPLINSKVGGVSNSKHINGHAVDIAPIGSSLGEFQSWLDRRWDGALGYGARKGFVHIDLRNNQGFNSQANSKKNIRWNY